MTRVAEITRMTGMIMTRITKDKKMTGMTGSHWEDMDD